MKKFMKRNVKPFNFFLNIFKIIVSGLFVMEADTGRLTVTASLDREKRDRYSLKVRAENVGRHRYGREISRSGK